MPSRDLVNSCSVWSGCLLMSSLVLRQNLQLAVRPAAVDEGPPNLSGHAHSPADYHNREQASAINWTTDEEYWRLVKLAL